MSAWLEHGSERRPLDAGTAYDVGSAEHAWWRLDDGTLAWRHVEIGWRHGGHHVAPHGADTVVLLNGTALPVSGAPLRDGDVIEAGSARFVYRTGDASSPPAEAGGTTAAPSTAWLVDDAAHVAHPLSAEQVRIGRDPGSEVLLRDATVSRHHAAVRHEAGRHVLHVTGSTGARVNGMRVSAAHVLDAGDTIEIGTRCFRYATGALPAGITLYTGHDPSSLEGHESLRRTTETIAAADPATMAAMHEATRRISAEQGSRTVGERSEPGGPSRLAIVIAVLVVLGILGLAVLL